MVILIDCRPLQYETNNEEKIGIIISFVNIISQQEKVEWFLLVDQTYQEGSLPGITGRQLLIRKALPGKLGWGIWNNWQIKSVVRKHKPDLVITTGNRASKSIGVPVWCWDWNKVWPGLPDTAVAPLSGNAREQIKAEQAGGREYFLVLVGREGAQKQLDLLKAFSLFKKRQRSNMRFIFASGGSWMDSVFAGKLDTYKYKEDVHCYEGLSATALRNLIGASYGFVYLYEGNNLGLTVLDAWKMEVPVIAGLKGKVPGWAGDAVLKADAADTKGLAEKLMILYKDELLRSNLTRLAGSKLESFSLKDSAARVWGEILPVMEGKSGRKTNKT